MRKRTYKEKTDYLLACLGEECGEVQQLVGKSLRFGLLSENPHNGDINMILLRNEINDISAAWMALKEHIGLAPYDPRDQSHIDAKIEKMELYSDPKYYVDDAIGEEIPDQGQESSLPSESNGGAPGAS